MTFGNGITRRDFIRGTAAAALAAALAPSARGAEAPTAAEKAKVVLVRDSRVLDEQGQVNAEVIGRMLDDGMSALLGTQTAADAWKALLKPTDLVGIKSNVWEALPTPPELVEAMRRGALAAGVAEDRIRADDRGARRTLADCTALLNARPLRSHHWAGIGGCIKNYMPFVESPPSYHEDSCANLGALWKLPIVAGKTRLNVLVVLRPLFHGRGPHHFDPRFCWDYKGLLLSLDPVAADSVGLRLLQAKRLKHFGEEVPFATNTRHVELAETRHHIGVADPARIDLVKLGWQEDVLI